MLTRRFVRTQIRHLLGLSALPLVLLGLALTSMPAAAATCSDYTDQAQAQRAADTLDGDADGMYCDQLPCPCSPRDGLLQDRARPTIEECVKPAEVQPMGFSRTKYPRIRRHFRAALRNGWPRVLVLNRPGADARRDRLLDGYPTREGRDRDEYPLQSGAAVAEIQPTAGTRGDGGPASGTFRAPRTARTAPPLASSCAAFATEPASSTSSTRAQADPIATARIIYPQTWS